MIYRISQEITRPANTTAYAANDVIGPVSGTSLITFSVGSNTASVTGAQVMSNAPADNSYALHLVSSSAYAPGIDNAALTAPVYGDSPVGSMLMAVTTGGLATIVEGTPLTLFGGALAIPTKFPFTGTVYAALQTLTGFTPTSGQKFRVTLFVEF